MNETNEPHGGVAILLARMESHPEEFAGLNMRRTGGLFEHYNRNEKWSMVLTTYWDALTAEEQTLINDALYIANRKNFYSSVVGELVNPNQAYLIEEEVTSYPKQLKLDLKYPKHEIIGIGTNMESK